MLMHVYLRVLNFLYYQIDSTKTNWLNSSVAWDSTKDNIFFIHGYAGGDNAPPLQLIREGKLNNCLVDDYCPNRSNKYKVHIKLIM